MATAKQIAARKRFAEMARSGAFKRKGGASRKKAASPKRKSAKAPSPAQLAARAKFVAMVRARARGKKRNGPSRLAPATPERKTAAKSDSSVRSPTSTSSDVRSPTRTATSTEAQTSGNVTVTGGAGRGATTRVSIHTAAPRGTKAQVGKKKNSRGFSGRAPAWTRSKKAKRVGLFNPAQRKALRVIAMRFNPGKIRFSEADLAKYAPKIKGLSLVGTSKSVAPKKRKASRFKKPAARGLARAFSGSGLLGLGRSRKTVRANSSRSKKRAQERAAGINLKPYNRKIRKALRSGRGAKARYLIGGQKKRSMFNPSPASVFSEFRGKDARTTTKSTGHGSGKLTVAQLGQLRELKLVGKKLEFGGRALLCADGRKKLHIGGVRFKANGGEQDMGEVRSVTYRSDKPHIEDGVLDYVHKFGEDGGKCPRLIVDSEGYPYFEGGSYKIDADGIIN